MFSPITRREALRRVGFLMGGALSASTVSAILSGCGGRVGSGVAYAFEILDEAQQELTATLVERILPETDTPGARAAGAHEFIDKMLSDWMQDADRTRFLAGLADVDARARQTHGNAFVDLDGAQQIALLTTLDREAYAPAPQIEEEAEEATAERAQSGTDAMQEEQEREVGQAGEPGSGETGGDPNARPPAPVVQGPPFFRMLKELTLAGYYTSEIGATQELQWLPSPGRYDADVPLSDVGRAWA